MSVDMLLGAMQRQLAACDVSSATDMGISNSTTRGNNISLLECSACTLLHSVQSSAFLSLALGFNL